MFTVDVTPFAQEGYARLEWDDTGISVDFYSWRVLRRLYGESTWDLIYETTDVDTDYVFDDYFAFANEVNEWALVQVTESASILTEGPYTIISDTPVSEDYWLLHPTTPAYNVHLYHVTEDAYHDEFEEATLQLIGRGRKKDQGTNFGKAGSLTADIRDNTSESAKQQREKIELLKETQTYVYLRTPFGQVWKIGLGQLEFTRTPGVGLREFGAMSIPYEEVA